jgi:hypothetical protein
VTSGPDWVSHLTLHVFPLRIRNQLGRENALSTLRSIVAPQLLRTSAPQQRGYHVYRGPYRAYTATPRPFRDQSSSAARLAARLQSAAALKLHPLATSKALLGGERRSPPAHLPTKRNARMPQAAGLGTDTHAGT